MLGVRIVDFSPDGRFVLSGAFDQRALLWEVTPTTRLPHLKDENHDLFNPSFSLSRNGTLIAAGREDGSVVVWDAGTGEPIGKYQAGANAVWFTGFTPDNRLLVTWAERVRVWDVESGAMLSEFNLDLSETGTVNYLDVSSEYILAAYEATDDWKGGVIAWNIHTGAEVKRFTAPLGALVVGISPDEKSLLAYNLADYLASIFDVATGKEILTIEVVNNNGLYRPSFSPNSRLLFTGGSVISTLWDLKGGKQLHELIGPRGFMVSSAFSHDGRYVAATSSDSAVRIWDSETGQEVRRFTPPFDTGFLNFSVNDDYLFIFGSDNEIEILYTRVEDVINDLCSRLIRDFTPEEREQYEIMDDAPTCPHSK